MTPLWLAWIEVAAIMFGVAAARILHMVGAR